MREKVSAERVERFMKAIGRAGKKNARIYFVGGATAVLLGWRETTIDVDVKILPEIDRVTSSSSSSQGRSSIECRTRLAGRFHPAITGLGGT